MTSSEIRKRFLSFFEKRGHAILPSASLVPKNDPSVLFNTAGMQPLVPYLLGEPHPQGKRLADVQKCVRTGDLEDIGDNRHFSFFEMMGNWSLGDYFKEEAIAWSYEFLTSKEEGLGLDPNRLYITIFEGDENAPYDQDSKDIWMKQGIPEHRIYALPADDNWWSPGDNGPCGPCSEMFYDMSGNTGDLTKEQFIKATKEERVIEIWNDVFMEYEKKDGKVVGKLKMKNVDTGAGLERITAVMQGKQTAYDTDLLEYAIQLVKSRSTKYNETYTRVIVDHIRSALFLVGDGVVPSSKNQGYILRRLIRRAVARGLKLEFSGEVFIGLINLYINTYKDFYPEINSEKNIEIINNEIIKFKSTLDQGIKEFEKGTDPFILATTYGFPIELTQELAKEKGQLIDIEDFKKKMEEHQKLSQSASAGMFKGGLANTNEKTVRLHTAHHLLLSALQQVLGKEVKQRGSNITEERLRIDFAFDRKMTDEEKKKVEEIVNNYIQRDLKVVRREMKREEAEQIGAEMEFGTKYPDTVSVYFIEDESGNAVSKEFCGGPHVTHTGELGIFKIQKEEASSAGIRRIKATLS
jgi:alanyl-tRNA synthetase